MALNVETGNASNINHDKNGGCDCKCVQCGIRFYKTTQFLILRWLTVADVFSDLIVIFAYFKYEETRFYSYILAVIYYLSARFQILLYVNYVFAGYKAQGVPSCNVNFIIALLLYLSLPITIIPGILGLIVGTCCCICLPCSSCYNYCTMKSRGVDDGVCRAVLYDIRTYGFLIAVLCVDTVTVFLYPIILFVSYGKTWIRFIYALFSGKTQDFLSKELEVAYEDSGMTGGNVKRPKFQNYLELIDMYEVIFETMPQISIQLYVLIMVQEENILSERNMMFLISVGIAGLKFLITLPKIICCQAFVAVKENEWSYND
eukprot:210472_1